MAKPSRPWLRGTGAIVAGFLACVILSLACDALMHLCGVFPPLGQTMAGGLFFLPLAYRTVLDGFSSYLTARLAPEPRWRYVWIGGGIGLLMGCLGIFASVQNPAMGPLWYPVALALSVPLSTWVGGRIYIRKQS
jgi:hypothetical protein